MSISQSNYLAHLSHAANTLYTQIHNRVTGILIFNDCSPHFSSIPFTPPTRGEISQHLVVLAIQSNSRQAGPSPPPHYSSHFILLTFPFFPLFKYLISPRWYIDTIYSPQRERLCTHHRRPLCFDKRFRRHQPPTPPPVEATPQSQGVTPPCDHPSPSHPFRAQLPSVGTSTYCCLPDLRCSAGDASTCSSSTLRDECRLHSLIKYSWWIRNILNICNLIFHSDEVSIARAAHLGIHHTYTHSPLPSNHRLNVVHLCTQALLPLSLVIIVH